jgi:hypothetical protein
VQFKFFDAEQTLSREERLTYLIIALKRDDAVLSARFVPEKGHSCAVLTFGDKPTVGFVMQTADILEMEKEGLLDFFPIN